MFYHFEVRTPSHILITEGLELPDKAAARLEAAKRIGDLLGDHAHRLWTDEEWEMNITDKDGLILYSIHVSALKAPAAGS